MKRMLMSVAGSVVAWLVPAVVLASETAAGTAGGSPWLPPALAIGSGLGIAIAAFGGGLGQGRAAAAALEGIARNPEAASKIQTLMIIALALIESLVIYALVIAFLLFGKIG